MFAIITVVVLLGTPLRVIQGKDCVYAPGYSGKVNVTNTGIPCQRWDSQNPHPHTRNQDNNFPNDGNATNANNYCRDPDGQHELFCYTTNKNVRWQNCDIETCEPPILRNEDCIDPLPQNETARDCPKDSTYYVCQRGSKVAPFSIEYDFECDFYHCCNHFIYMTRTEQPSITFDQSFFTTEFNPNEKNNENILNKTDLDFFSQSTKRYSGGIKHSTEQKNSDNESTMKFTEKVTVGSNDATDMSTSDTSTHVSTQENEGSSRRTSTTSTTQDTDESIYQLESGSTNCFRVTLKEIVFLFLVPMFTCHV